MGTTPARGVPFVCSWSGGKDSCLALYRAMQAGAEPAFLLSMLREDGARSRSHGLPLDVLEAQAASLGIPLVARTASWSDYESVIVAALRELKDAGARAGVFGDIDLDCHREWEEKVCGAARIEAWLPLWRTPRLALLNEFLLLGFEVGRRDRRRKAGEGLLGKGARPRTGGRVRAPAYRPVGRGGGVSHPRHRRPDLRPAAAGGVWRAHALRWALVLGCASEALRVRRGSVTSHVSRFSWRHGVSA